MTGAMHVLSLDQDTLDHGRLPGSVWVVKARDDGWYDVDHTIDGKDALEAIGSGRGFSTPHHHMIVEYMTLLGMVRHDRGADDAPNVVETWQVDPEPGYPVPPTSPRPPDHPPS
jgi:hypothetical protein